MARTKGDFEFSANFEVKKKATLDARQYVNNYSELLEFTASDYIPYGFPVACGGQDDPTKLGIWQCVDPNDLSNPLSWVRSNEPIPFNQVIQVGSFSLDTVSYLATLGETTAWAFNENGINYEVGETDVQMNAPDSTYTRADIIVWSSTAGYQLIEGTPAEDYQIPNTPVGTILVQTIIRNVDGSTEPVEPPDLSGFAKLAGGNNFNGKQRFSGERYIEVQGSDRGGFRAFDVAGNYLGDFQFENSPGFKGFKVSGNLNYPANPSVQSRPYLAIHAETRNVELFGSPILNAQDANSFVTTGADKKVESRYKPISPYITNATTQGRLNTDTNWNEAGAYTGPAIEENQGTEYVNGRFYYWMYDPVTPYRMTIDGSQRHLKGNSGTPTIAAGAAAGTSPTIAIQGNDVSVRVTLTTGTSPASGVLFTVTFNTPFTSAPRVQITARNNNVAEKYTEFFVSNETTTTFVISTRTALPASTQFIFNFLIAQ